MYQLIIIETFKNLRMKKRYKNVKALLNLGQDKNVAYISYESSVIILEIISNRRASVRPETLHFFTIKDIFNTSLS